MCRIGTRTATVTFKTLILKVFLVSGTIKVVILISPTKFNVLPKNITKVYEHRACIAFNSAIRKIKEIQQTRHYKPTGILSLLFIFFIINLYLVLC